MYPSNAVLKRDKPLKIDGTVDGRKAKVDDPLNHLRVVAVSPISTASREEWAGGSGEHLIVQPLDEFGSNEVIPFSYLQAHYSIESMPDASPTSVKFDPDHLQGRAQRQMSPEEQFARNAKVDELTVANV